MVRCSFVVGLLPPRLSAVLSRRFLTVPRYSLFDKRSDRSLNVAAPARIAGCMGRLIRIAFRPPFAWPAVPAFRLFASFCQPLRRPATALATAIGKAFQVHDGVNDEFSFAAEFAMTEALVGSDHRRDRSAPLR